MVSLEGGWEQHLFLAEGRCEGSINGRFRGANFPQRRTAAGPFRPDFRAVIDTDDGAAIMFELHGYGRAYPPGRRQIVGSVFHLSDSDRYRRLNDVVCVCVGEVRAPDDPRPGELRPHHRRRRTHLGTNSRVTMPHHPRPPTKLTLEVDAKPAN